MKLIFTKAITKDVRKIKDKKLQQKIEETILSLKNASELFEVSSVKKISGHPDAYRIRIGDYRLGFYVHEETIILMRFLKRNDIYKNFP